MNSVALGALVEHVSKPDWGIGKVVAVEEDTVHVFFVDRPGEEAVAIRDSEDSPRLRPASTQFHALLDNTPPFVKVGARYRLKTSRLTFEQALQQFLGRFPRGFVDPAYLGDQTTGERNYKWWCHQRFEAEFAEGNARVLLERHDVAELRRKLFAVDNRNNLLHPKWDKAPLRDGLADDDAALGYFQALLDYIEAVEPTEDKFVSLIAALSRMPQPGSEVASWPVATVFPFLAAPHRDIFLRPTQAQHAAQLMAFELNYEARPNWRTYSCWLTLAKLMLERLGPHGAKDFIDVQSFLYALKYC